MLNPAAKLAPNTLDPKVEQKPTRDGYGTGLVKAGKNDPNIVVLCADLTESTRSLGFKQAYPERSITVGVSEQSLASIAAGMAAMGKTPFISSYAMFSPGRNWEQIRTNLCLNNMNVKVAGPHSGVSVGPDGATHQAVEDIAITRCIPNITVIVPCDSIETEKTTLAAATMPGPFYFRFAREKTPLFTTEGTPFTVGKAEVFRNGKDVALIACGPLVHNALLAAEELAKDGIDARVINNHTIKPMDEKTIAAAAKECGAVVTIEEHQVQGGMGSRVAEILAQKEPVPIEFIGVQNKFGQSGEPNELIEHYGMGVSHIVAAAKKVLKRKQ